MSVKTIPIYTLDGKRLLTLKEAEHKGYGSVITLKQRIRRGRLKGFRVATILLVLEESLVN